MNDNYTNVLNIELEAIAGKPTVSSLAVAEHFGKNHRDVLKKIKLLQSELSDSLCERNFAPTSINIAQPNGGSRETPAYRISRDGFSLLAMGFTGKKALAWKVKYIEAFNAMEQALLERPSETKLEVPILVSTAQLPAVKSKGLSEKQKRVAKGLTSFWAYLEGTSSELAEEHVAKALKSSQVEAISKTDFGLTMFMLERLLFRVSPIKSGEPYATEAELAPLRGLLDYCGNLSEEHDQDFVERVICIICNVEEIEDLTSIGVQKALFALWGFINRYKTLYSDHLRKACEIAVAESEA